MRGALILSRIVLPPFYSNALFKCADVSRVVLILMSVPECGDAFKN